ncbi:MAG: response regulator [Rhodocyclaceae bacterium]|nr:response regulator [Rhodocyclaceae bacterium]
MKKKVGQRVLVVDDEPINRAIAACMLGEICCLTVDQANNGMEAVEMSRRESYDLILMDMQMPVMDGPEATRQIRRIPGRQTVPILAFTANALDEARECCLEAGMNDFLAKPAIPEVFRATLLKWLGRHESRLEDRS